MAERNDYSESIYNQIIHADTSRKFSQAVRWLITKHLFKVDLPIEVREDFINDITEIYMQKFGYTDKLEPALFEALANLFMQEDVRSQKVMSPDGTVKNYTHPVSGKLEYSFNSARKDRHEREEPYKRVVPVGDTILSYNVDPAIYSVYWDGGMSDTENIIDLRQAMQKAKLTTMQQDLIWLNAVVGMSVREIADLGAPFPKKTMVAVYLREAKDLLVKVSDNVE